MKIKNKFIKLVTNKLLFNAVTYYVSIYSYLKRKKLCKVRKCSITQSEVLKGKYAKTNIIY